MSLRRPSRLTLLLIFVTCVVFVLPCLWWWRKGGQTTTETKAKADYVVLDFSRGDGAEEHNDIASDDQSCRDVEYGISDMRRVSASVLQELRDIGRRRQHLLGDIANATDVLGKMEKEFRIKESQLHLLQAQVVQAQFAQTEALLRNIPDIHLPLRLPLVDAASDANYANEVLAEYGSHCSIAAPFKIAFVSKSKPRPTLHDAHPPTYVDRLLAKIREEMFDYVIDDVSAACVVIATEEDDVARLLSEGRRVLIITQHPDNIARDTHRRSMIASPSFPTSAVFRPNVDILLPGIPIVDDTSITMENVWRHLPMLLPVKRTYLASLVGRFDSASTSSPTCAKAMENVMRVASAVNHTTTNDRFHVDLSCSAESSTSTLCADFERRRSILANSQYSLIPLTDCGRRLGGDDVARIMEAMHFGAVPVLIGNAHSSPLSLHLPFGADNAIDFAQAVLHIDASRMSEVHFLLRSVYPLQLVEMRRSGRVVYARFMATWDVQARTVVDVVRSRLALPPNVSPLVVMRGVFGGDDRPPNVTSMPLLNDPDDIIGPLEPPHNSPRYQDNHTLFHGLRHRSWNTLHSTVSHLMPNLPITDVVAPMEVQFESAVNHGFRPIGDGLGGSGVEFGESLGGDRPTEQFTIVILHYDRVSVLLRVLQGLNALPYLHRVIVVCNHENSTSTLSKFELPRLHVDVRVVTNGRNSLNNRFLPLLLVETEAVLSLDDDVMLTHEEIVFAFRVWREHRDRIVGFPARYHSYADGRLMYNSNHTCQHSMILTGAAFIHTYFLHEYTYRMPSAIRAKVDQVMNCEDLAMNFLVSHITRKPPIKVTSKWTFPRPRTDGTTTENLSDDEHHFAERHDCMAFFAQVYGYTPLVNTQFRADSVLFKTKLPEVHKKCFKFV